MNSFTYKYQNLRIFNQWKTINHTTYTWYFFNTPLKCEFTMLPLKWKLFLLPQTLIPHKMFLIHHSDIFDTLQRNVFYLSHWRRLIFDTSKIIRLWNNLLEDFSLWSIVNYETCSFKALLRGFFKMFFIRNFFTITIIHIIFDTFSTTIIILFFLVFNF